MRNQIVTQKVIGEEVGSHLNITTEEQQKWYDEHKQEMEQPESIRLSEILIAPPKVADKPAPDKPTENAAADSNAAGSDNANPEAAKQAEEATALAAAETKANELLKQIRAERTSTISRKRIFRPLGSTRRRPGRLQAWNSRQGN